MTNIQLIGAIAVDLKRIARAYSNNSLDTGKRFVIEVAETQKEINSAAIESYMQKIFQQLPKILENHDYLELAEDALMYSTILQNYYVSRTQK